MVKNRLSHKERKLRREQIKELMSSGESIEDISNKFGVSESYIKTMRTNELPHRDRIFKVIAMLLKNMDQAEIARIEGVSRQYVSQVFRKCKGFQIV